MSSSGLTDEQVSEMRDQYQRLASEYYHGTGKATTANHRAMHEIYEQYTEVTTRRKIRNHLSDMKSGQEFKHREYLIPEHEINEDDEPALNELPTDKWSREADKPYVRDSDGNLVYNLRTYPGRFFVMSPEDREDIYEWYSNWDGSEDAINTICRRVGMRRPWFKEWKLLEGLTHDSEPFPDEKIMNSDIESLTDDLLMMRKKKLQKDWREKEEREIRKAAENFWHLENNLMLPLVDYLKKAGDFERPEIDYDITINSTKKESYGLVMGIGDTHLGRPAHEHENYTIEDSVEQTMELFERSLERSLYWGKPDEIYLLFLGDIFQYDTENQETGYGNRRSSVALPGEVLDAGFSMANSMIGMVREIADTTVRIVPGNHDPMLSRALLWQVHEAWGDDVDTELTWDRQQYVKYGNNLIGLTHACELNPEKLPEIMPRDAHEIWSKTDNRYYLYGHPHRPEIKHPDESGVELISVGTPAEHDEYEHKKKYEAVNPQISGYIFDPTEGRVGMPTAAKT